MEFSSDMGNVMMLISFASRFGAVVLGPGWARPTMPHDNPATQAAMKPLAPKPSASAQDGSAHGDQSYLHPSGVGPLTPVGHRTEPCRCQSQGRAHKSRHRHLNEDGPEHCPTTTTNPSPRAGTTPSARTNRSPKSRSDCGSSTARIGPPSTRSGSSLLSGGPMEVGFSGS